MGNSTNITMGNGSLSINGTDVGYLKDKTTAKFESEIKRVEVSTPGSTVKKLVKIFPLSAKFTLQAEMLEITGDNVGKALGGLTPVTVAGSLVDKTSTWESLTFAAHPLGGPFQSVKLGPTANMSQSVTISADTDAPVIGTNVSSPVSYTEGSDYTVDYTTGYVYRNPSGTISEGETVKCKYKYTPPASRRMDLGASYVQSEFELEFVHTNPTTLKTVTVHMWKASPTPSFNFEFSSGDELMLNPEFEAIDDTTNHPTNPLGYIEIEE